jgi:hypothetical protein
MVAALCALPPVPAGQHCAAASAGSVRLVFAAGPRSFPPVTVRESGPSAPVANKTVSDNLLAGGAYTIYGGAASGSPTSNIVIQDNRFGQLYYAKSGLCGPAYYFSTTGTGNKWSMNIWDTTGQPAE